VNGHSWDVAIEISMDYWATERILLNNENATSERKTLNRQNDRGSAVNNLLCELFVLPVGKHDAATICRQQHYLLRRPPISFAYGIFDAELFGNLLGVVTFGIPASRHLMQSACGTNPDAVIELNRLWVDDVLGRNTESWFLKRALEWLPPFVVVSYADTAHGHNGYVYRASNFDYAGVTDMDRKTPRFDYVTPGKHSRDTTRNGTMETAEKVRRMPKHRYWTVTGNKRERRDLRRIVTWPSMSWGAFDVRARVSA
jgi:hypothetical protein